MIRWILYILAGVAILTGSTVAALVGIGWHYWKERAHG